MHKTSIWPLHHYVPLTLDYPPPPPPPPPPQSGYRRVISGGGSTPHLHLGSRLWHSLLLVDHGAAIPRPTPSCASDHPTPTTSFWPPDEFFDRCSSTRAFLPIFPDGHPDIRHVLLPPRYGGGDIFWFRGGLVVFERAQNNIWNPRHPWPSCSYFNLLSCVPPNSPLSRMIK